MSNLNTIKSKIYALEGLKIQVDSWKKSGESSDFAFGLVSGSEVYNTTMILLSKKTQFGLTPAELDKLNR